MQFIDLNAQYQRYKDEIDREIHSVLDRSQYILGPTLRNLEEEMGRYCGAEAIGCSSGTDALLLALMALDIKPGDEIITSPYTFISTAEVVMLLGAKPVFVDVDVETFNIDPELIAEAVTSKTKAIIPVSLFGEVSNMKAINRIAEKHNLPVIEDAAQSFGASYQGKKSCNLSLLATTSFYPAKPLGGYGDGGAVFTNDPQLAEKIRQLLNHGQNKQYQHRYVGINGRLDDLQAAVLKVKLRYLDEEISKRNSIAIRYDTEISDEKYYHQKRSPEGSSAWAQYSLVMKNQNQRRHQTREELLNGLRGKGVPTAIYYPIPLHLQEVFTPLGHHRGDFPVSERLSESMFSIPIHPLLKNEEVDQVIAGLNSSLS